MLVSLHGTTDCRVCAAMRERIRTFLALGMITAAEGAAWLGLATVFFVIGFEWRLTAILLSASALLHFTRERISISLALWLDKRLRAPLIQRAVHAKFLGHNYGPEINLDLKKIRGFLMGPVLILYDLIWAPMTIVAGLLYDVRLGVALIFAFTSFAIILFFCERGSRKSRYEIDIRGMLGRQLLHSAYRYAEEIEAMKMMPAVIARYSGQNDEELARTGSRDRQFAMLRIAAFATCAATIIFSIWLLASTPSLVGDLGRIAAAVIITGLLIIPFFRASIRWREIGEYRETVQRLKAFAMSPPFKKDEGGEPASGGDLTAEGLQYGVAPGAPLVLKDVSFAVSEGEVLVVLGPSGAGKTTLARLIVGVAAPSLGSIRLGGAPTFTMPSGEDSSVGYLSQNFNLFDTDIAENIARLGTVDPQKVTEAAAIAGVHDTILTLPGQYRAQIGADGERLAAGLRQRIALARAIYGNPRCVVLDEPNSNLDGDGELALARAVAELRARRITTVIITQRPGIVQSADKLLVLEDGAVVSFGPPSRVLAELGSRAA